MYISVRAWKCLCVVDGFIVGNLGLRQMRNDELVDRMVAAAYELNKWDLK